MTQSGYTIQEIAAITHGYLIQQGESAIIQHLLTDSRKIYTPYGSLFFALQTQRQNGHHFIEACYQKGVRHFVVHDRIDFKDYPDANFIIVNNTLKALQQLGAHHRSRFHYPVIGITGSNGKTIVKEWLYQLLNEKYQIVRSPRSYNSQIGVPLSVWAMNERHTLGIFEAGISTTGEMQPLADIIQPTIAVLTNIGDAHDEGFADRSEKTREKALLLQKASTVIVGDAYIDAIPDLLNTRELFIYGSSPQATLRILEISKQSTVTHIHGNYRNTALSITIPFTDDASISNAITCWAVCLCLGVPNAWLEEKFPHLKAISLRLEVKKGRHNTTIINDSYSADLSSLAIAMDMLGQQHQHPRRTLIISDFQCAPSEETHLYQTIAQLASLYKIDQLISVGDKSAHYFPQYLSTTVVYHSFLTTDALLNALDRLSFHHESILIKGARVFELDKLLPLLEEQLHQTRLEINLSNIAANLRAYRQWIKPGTKLMMMVKAFSYGSGAHEIAALVQYHGADYLAVAFTDEGVALRRAGITLPIMVMNPEPLSFPLMAAYNLEPEIFSFHILTQLQQFLQKEGIVNFPIHLKIDTGMHRLGFLPHEIGTLCQRLNEAPYFIIRSVFSHLVASEDPDEDAFSQHQAALFEAACQTLRASTGQPFLMHLANTSAILRHPQWHYDMVRLGIGLYGIAGNASSPLQLEHALSLKTTIAQIKHLQPGDTVGYNRKGKIFQPSTIATVRIGYADGYPRSLGNGKAFMLVKGKPAPTIGNVCMDMTMIDVTGIENVQDGDEVIVFGKELPIQRLAAWHGTIPYEIMTGISQRVKRIYFEE